MILQLDNVTFRYEDAEKNALDSLSLGIEEGEFVAVLGHNGSGKSTLGKLFNAILLPGEGRVLVCGMDTKEEKNLLAVRQTVGMVFQNPDNQIVATTVEEDVAFGLENLGVPREEMRARIDDALKTVHMEDYKKHAPHLLSGGQKQRVAIAGVIAMRPRCIVLDEPTAMLDPTGRREVIDTIERLNRDYGITILLITHHMMEAARARRLVVLEEGGIFAEGTPGEVFCRVEELRAVGLGVPQTVELLHALKEDGYDVCLSALDIEDAAEEILRLAAAK